MRYMSQLAGHAGIPVLVDVIELIQKLSQNHLLPV